MVVGLVERLWLQMWLCSVVQLRGIVFDFKVVVDLKFFVLNNHSILSILARTMRSCLKIP